jgi:hypothetical protein
MPRTEKRFAPTLDGLEARISLSDTGYATTEELIIQGQREQEAEALVKQSLEPMPEPEVAEGSYWEQFTGFLDSLFWDVPEGNDLDTAIQTANEAQIPVLILTP